MHLNMNFLTIKHNGGGMFKMQEKWRMQIGKHL